MVRGSQSPAEADSLEIRSYRAVFELDRRIYRIDRLRLNPGGVPLRAVVYFMACALADIVLLRMPLIRSVGGTVPWYLRELAVPLLAAAVLTLVRIDGRAVHVVAVSALRRLAQPPTLCRLGSGGRPDGSWRPAALLLLPDGSEAHMRRLAYRGPGAVRISVAHERVEWRRGTWSSLLRRPELTVREIEGAVGPAPATLIELAAGARMASERGASASPSARMPSA